MFRSPQLRCNLSGLSVNVDERQITQSLKVRDFFKIDDHITTIWRSTYFHIRNIGKIRNLLSYNACSTINHALISCRLDYCNSLLYNSPAAKWVKCDSEYIQCFLWILVPETTNNKNPTDAILSSLIVF